MPYGRDLFQTLMPNCKLVAGWGAGTDHIDIAWFNEQYVLHIVTRPLGQLVLVKSHSQSSGRML